MRRLAVVACAFGLLFALTASSAAAKVIDVPGTAVFRAGNNGPPNCTARVYIQWPEQENAQAWELEYEYLRGTGDHLTEKTVRLSPPFDDAPDSKYGWAPPAGHHWHYHTYRSTSAPGKTVKCDGYEAEMLARVISATVHVTVPDGPSCSALEARERRLQRRLRTARKGGRRARNRFMAAQKRVRVANRRLRRSRAAGPRSLILRTEEAKQRAVQARGIQRRVMRDTRKTAQGIRKVIRDVRTTQTKLCPAD